MNATQKMAWLELIVSLAALALVCALLPWLGDRAAGGFGLMGFLGFGVLFYWPRQEKVLADERDNQIQSKATAIGFGTSWMLLVMSLIAIMQWSAFSRDHVIPMSVINWLIWISFATSYGIKGLAALVLYRSGHAA